MHKDGFNCDKNQTMNKEIQLTTEFRSQTVKAITSIAFFAIMYMLLLLLSIGLTVLCIYGGIALIAVKPMFITIALGVGLGSLGIMVLVFLLKFIFQSNKVDDSNHYEIKKEQEPEIFGLIDEIVTKVGTHFPKKVYLSPDVNASVFYDSSFWSMFFPVKKNLTIGLGLINTVTQNELKAILSHEFGHFSQKTMKVGSYVHYVNRAIFNMLYENDSYNQLIRNWAEASGYFSIFAILASAIVNVIQEILKKLYEVVNKNYLGLSREMEFHADEIASHVTGYIPLKSSLLRMELADHSFHSVLAFYQERIKEGLNSQNMFKEQKFVMNFLAIDSNLPIEDTLPKVSLSTLNKFNKSKLEIDNQWSSHPSIDERIKRLEKGNVTLLNAEDKPANTLFKNIKKLQQEVTNQVFKEIKYEKEVEVMTFEEFQSQYKKDFLDNSFSKVYNGYFDNKNPMQFEVTKDRPLESFTIDELFSDTKLNLVYTSIALQNDIEVIKNIENKLLPVKTFDYDGKRYKRKEINTLLPKIISEQDSVNEQIKANDIRIFTFFKTIENNQMSSSKLDKLYIDFFEYDKGMDSKYDVYIQLSEGLLFINEITPFDEIKSNFSKIEPIEQKLKEEIQIILKDNNYQNEMSKDIKDNFESYLSKKWQYFGHEKYFENNLEILFTAMENYASLLSKRYFIKKKRLLEYQIDILEGKQDTKE